MRPTFLVGVTTWLVLWMVGVSSAWAHANLETASPSSNATLPTAPRQVRILFSEEPESAFSEIAVYEASGQRVATGPLQVVPGQPRGLVVDLPALVDGPYTVAWKTLSAVDGHVAAGSYSFAVGAGQVPGSPAVPATADATGSPTSIDWPSAVVRWLTYLSIAVLSGAVPFFGWIARPSIRPAPELIQMLRRITRMAAVIAILAGLAGLLIEAGDASGVGPIGALGGPVVSLLKTRYGMLWAARMVLIVALALLLPLPAGPSSRRGYAAVRAGGLLAAGALLATLSLNSHAAAMRVDPGTALALDWVHLAGMSIWVGGLVMLAACAAVLTRSREEGRRRQIGRLVARFSPFATWAVIGIVLSGLYQGLIQVGTLDALTSTPYGQSLVWKIALVIPMLGIGFVNTAVLRPRLAAQVGIAKSETEPFPDNRARVSALGKIFMATVGLEAILGVLVLAATGVLTTQEPAREAIARAPRTFDTTQQADDLRIRLVIAPAMAGLNTVSISLLDTRGRPIDAQRVTLRLQHLEHDMGENEVTLDPAGDGRWTTQGSFLSMVGRWQVAVLVRRDGRDDARSDFVVPAGDPTLPSTRPAGTLSLGSSALGGVALLLAAIAVLGQARTLRRPAVGRVTSAVVAAGGLYLLWTGITRDVTPTFAISNPIPPSRESIARGQEVYLENCFACHGPTGRGDGPAGRALRPPPADLRVHVNAHTEGQLYWWISKGFPGSAMPAFEETLSEEDRWHVLNFIVQTFGPNGGQS